MLKKLKLIYNPLSGDKTFLYALDACVQAFQAGGYETHLYRLGPGSNIDEAIADMDDRYQAIIAAGGDGTVNLIVNALMRSRRRIPLGLIPAGTANDFAASFLKMPKEPQAAAEAIMMGRTTTCDLGRVNGQYFINVCGAGLLTNISQHIDADFKDSLGMLAYYIKGIEQLPNFVPLPVSITTPSQRLEEELYLFLALNGAGAGGFELSPQSRIDDGMLDFIALRAVSIRELAVLFIKMLKGSYLEDSSVIYLRERQISVESLSKNQTPLHYETDIDGEKGPDLPVLIECVPEAITLFVPEAYR